MAIGERIKFIRNLRGMTQKYLGQAIGFDKRTADVRIAQYESGTRTPKENITKALAEVLNVVPPALEVPNIDSYIGLAHTLFALEDMYGIHIDKREDEVCLTLDKDNRTSYRTLFDFFSAWQKEAEKLKTGGISREEYDAWRYTYPEIEAKRTREALDAIRTERKAKHKE
ncbi:MAG: helix-turn-helix transcriptional regulator [Christensenella sp.]|nr:helix-turn-helix transcriptional regulator [Christensenella sp.]